MAKITEKQFETILQTVIAEQVEAEIARSQAQSSVVLPDEAARERQWQAICASAAEAAGKRSRRTARRWAYARWAAMAAVAVGLFAALVFNGKTTTYAAFRGPVLHDYGDGQHLGVVLELPEKPLLDGFAEFLRPCYIPEGWVVVADELRPWDLSVTMRDESGGERREIVYTQLLYRDGEVFIQPDFCQKEVVTVNGVDAFLFRYRDDAPYRLILVWSDRYAHVIGAYGADLETVITIAESLSVW